MLMLNQAGNRRSADPAELPVSRLVPEPAGARRLARTLGLLFLLVMAIFSVAPWQQTVSGAGQVIAFSANERPQQVQSPVKGRVLRWFVSEGERIRNGDPIVEVQDNDPNYFARLRQGREVVEGQLQVYEAQVEQLTSYVSSLEEARDQAVEVAESEIGQAKQKLRAKRQKRLAAEGASHTASLNLRRTKSLFERGIESQRKLELAELKSMKAETELAGAIADVQAAKAALDGKRSALKNKRAVASAKVESARASRGKAKASVQDARAKLVDFEVKMARQSVQLITAPTDGTVFRIQRSSGQEQVKPGDLLATLVPDSHDRVAAIMVDGNDAPIISPGRKVRLQFEGWPAVQFAGWPSVAVGSFGGIVAVVDSADDGKGDFRVLVRPDPESQVWPDVSYLRQGTRAKAWILLDQVTIGYELWRRFNGFPPATKVAPTGSGKATNKGKKSGKGHSK